MHRVLGRVARQRHSAAAPPLLDACWDAPPRPPAAAARAPPRSSRVRGPGGRRLRPAVASAFARVEAGDVAVGRDAARSARVPSFPGPRAFFDVDALAGAAAGRADGEGLAQISPAEAGNASCGGGGGGGGGAVAAAAARLAAAAPPLRAAPPAAPPEWPASSAPAVDAVLHFAAATLGRSAGGEGAAARLSARLPRRLRARPAAPPQPLPPHDRLGAAELQALARRLRIGEDQVHGEPGVGAPGPGAPDAGAAAKPASGPPLTPAQIFFLENKDKLLARTHEYHEAKRRHFEDMRVEAEDSALRGARFDTFYRDPVMRLPRAFLWDAPGDEASNEEEEPTVDFQQGKMPSIEEFVRVLSHERIADIRVVDLAKCGRKDLGMFFIIGTAVTAIQCVRVGKIMAALVRMLKVPHISRTAYCAAGIHDPWAVAHCGPVQIHLQTEAARGKFEIERLLLAPHEHFHPNRFAGYFDCLTGQPPPYVVEYLESLRRRDEEVNAALAVANPAAEP